MQAYRTGPWTTAAECVTWVGTVDGLGVEDVLSLLRVLTDGEMRGDELLHPPRSVAFGRRAAGVRDRALLPHYLAALRIPDKFIRANIGPLLPQVTVVSDHPLI